jgi:hypothetical protein
MQYTHLTGDIDFAELEQLCTDDVNRHIVVHGNVLKFPRAIHKTTSARKIIDMGGTPLRCYNADGLFMSEQKSRGGYKRSFYLDGITDAWVDKARYPDATVLHMINNNFSGIGTVGGKNFGTCVRQTNFGSNAWSEFNEYDLIDSNGCAQGWVSDNVQGANGSQRGTIIRSLKVFGAARPFRINKDIKFYNSRVWGDIGAHAGYGSAQMCILGDVHGTSFDVGIENGCEIGWYFEHETSASCRVRSSFIHPKSVGDFVVLADQARRPRWLEISYGQEEDNPNFDGLDPITDWT